MILETGELGTYDNVRRASLLAIAAGADFIKTSTGKVSPAATLPVTLCMLEVIRDVHDETGHIVGMKPAGGIRTAKQAIQYLCVLERDARDRLDDARALPLRRLVAPERRADADPQAANAAPISPATTSRSTDRMAIVEPPAREQTLVPQSHELCLSAAQAAQSHKGRHPSS